MTENKCRDRRWLDQIKIRHLEVFGNHGVFPEETKLGQKFLVNAVLYTDTRNAGLSDNLGLSIHYGEVCQEIHRFLKEHTYRLIESAAERLAEHLLLTIPRLSWLDLEILKPWAPIGLPLETVSVSISRGWHQAYLAFGSNLGDRRAYIEEAVEKLSGLTGCRVEQVSGILETEAYGGVEQGPFLNGCLSLKTILTPEELLREMNRIEAEAGRERLVRWGPRTLDLDLIFYDDLVTEDAHLLLPHPDMQNRTFVLEPLAQLCPCKRHPITGETVLQMLGRLRESQEHDSGAGGGYLLSCAEAGKGEEV